MTDMVSVPAEKIAALREALDKQYSYEPKRAYVIPKVVNDTLHAARALVDAVETEVAPDELTALRADLEVQQKQNKELAAERDALRERVRALVDDWDVKVTTAREDAGLALNVASDELRAALGDA